MSVKQESAEAKPSTFGVARSPRSLPPCRRGAAESRIAPRKEVIGQGIVRIPGYRMSLPCQLVNISATGACLRFLDVNTNHLPDRIVVVFSTDRTEIDATIQWRAAQECGVYFVSLFRKIEINNPSR